MEINKKLFLIFTFCLFVFSACSVSAVQNNNEGMYKEIKEKKLLEISKTSRLSGYLLKDNKLYLAIWKSDEGRYIYKYENGNLKLLKLSKSEIERWIEEYKIPYSDDLADEKLKVNEDMYLKLKGWEMGINFYNLYIYDGKKERNVTKDRFLAELNSNYLYIDKENQKIYFNAWNRTQYIDKKSKDVESGMFIYDIKADKFEFFKGGKSEIDKDGNEVNTSYINPIRVPNTAYLMYIGDKKTSYKKESRTMNTGLEVWIQEIPEWKAEIEAK